mgnify:CR=1 FL=1
MIDLSGDFFSFLDFTLYDFNEGLLIVRYLPLMAFLLQLLPYKIPTKLLIGAIYILFWYYIIWLAVHFIV